ncbi:hypothetical protein MSAN_00248900 [Mycena sanguinolenta]|uniref:PARP catalytic domain-containing protein n=1 Tax=Mycena sanguinolenta TaxID=230812 RepID=A0A8H6ZFW7_9AGAR|nr:hypothetical protein MSAN_00248900 [Mycena sanguinolenta]
MKCASNATRSRNSSSLEVIGTHIAAGAAQDRPRVRTRLLAHFVDVARQENRHFPIFARRSMEGEFFVPNSGQAKVTLASNRQAVQSGQVEGCDSCHEHPRASGDLCIVCDRKVVGPRLKELTVGGVTFADVRSQFLSGWHSLNAVRPRVHKVYQISVPSHIRALHNAYRANQRATEEIRVFHSAQCICDMGTKTAALCNYKSCGICCIIRSSFNGFAFGEKYNIGRFGEGIYSYKNPSLADVHATSATSTPYRVVIACDVAVEANLEVPDEKSLFVPCADAIVPVFIIMYTM